MKRWQISILIFELALFAAILVLPQVALPDLPSMTGLRRWRRIRVFVSRRPARQLRCDPQILVPDQVVQRSRRTYRSLSVPAHQFPAFAALRSDLLVRPVPSSPVNFLKSLLREGRA